MAFNIQEFKSFISKSGISKAANFEVMIGGADRDMMMRCTRATTPGRSISTTETTDYSMPQVMGYLSASDSVTTDIILSEDLREKEFFETWMDSIVGDYRSGSISDQMYDIGFLDDYSSIVEIIQYDELGNKRYKHTLQNAFPVIVSSLQGDWAADEIQFLSVSWKYRFYTTKKL